MELGVRYVLLLHGGDVVKHARLRINELMDMIAPNIRPTRYNHTEREVLKWFRENFEIFGKSERISGHMVDRDDYPQFREHTEKKLAAQMGQAIYEICGVSREEVKTSDDPFKPRWNPNELPLNDDRELTVQVLAMKRRR